MICNACKGTGFQNHHQIPCFSLWSFETILAWLFDDPDTDAKVCDCCGNGKDGWHGIPGQHYSEDDPSGPTGPYKYNGGVCECQ